MYKPLIVGEYKAVCDVCGRIYHNIDLKLRWDGRMVCPDDFETQQPLDFQKIPRTEKSVPWSRPVPANEFDVVTYGNTIESVPTGTFNVADPIGSAHGVR